MVCLGRPVYVKGVQGADYRAVIGLMNQLETIVHDSMRSLELSWESLTPSERADQLAKLIAYSVGKFIQIHPFLNGNGRCSRLLWAWHLARFGISPMYRISHQPAGDYKTVMTACMHGQLGYLTVIIAQHLAQKEPSRI